MKFQNKVKLHKFQIPPEGTLYLFALLSLDGQDGADGVGGEEAADVGVHLRQSDGSELLGKVESVFGTRAEDLIEGQAGAD